MKRKQSSNGFNTVTHIELSRRTAIHEAGHAVAIYFGNKQKQLPPVFFQIIINDCSYYADDNYPTKIEGGRLIHTLPISIEKTNGNLSAAQQHAYQQAFEADIINLLVGSLAEAHYVAHRDNELISPRLVPMNALHNYGGSSDLKIVDEYLQCFIVDKMQQEKKITELFWAAFEFINDGFHWSAITALADYILKNNKNIIDYEEVATVLNTHFLMAGKGTCY
ncbi:MAG: hypothetical protein LUO95_09195 [Methylococcaceae bacterium]|nr:hypothetical protein [Methylococcaceae bacterium]MDD1616896.1 hypothetical protein [Methylococcaceae bacterium]OYV16538.1 MAG: hypothetical protein CG439_2070 [Methylococcaceae bacterium NSP1-2]